MRRKPLDELDLRLVERAAVTDPADLEDDAEDGAEDTPQIDERDGCEQQLLRLDRALLYSSAEGDDDWVYLPGGLDGEQDFRVAGVEQVQARRRAERVWGRALRMAEEVSPYAAASVEARIRWQGFCRRGEVRARMRELSARLETFDDLTPVPAAVA
ncbi:MAG TPA: hypothetical protein PK668_10125 [Myxococcota bacterium]|nr:hypothetical protein [Myxococcota bacterium]HRY93477.1 hypothetical protein [Myxococcota bacterium]